MELCTEGFTLTYWTDAVPTVPQVTVIGLGCGRLEHRQGVRIDFGSGMIYVSVKFPDEFQITVYTFNQPEGWFHHGLIAKKGQKPHYLLNGTAITPLAQLITPTTSTLHGRVRIGNHYEEVEPSSFHGKIDDVRLWKKAKCPEFIKYVYDIYKN